MPPESDFLRYEEGLFTREEEIRFFARLIRSGLIPKLTSGFVHQAAGMIKRGLVDEQGFVNEEVLRDVLEEERQALRKRMEDRSGC